VSYRLQGFGDVILAPTNGAPWGPPTATGNCTLGNLNILGKCVPFPVVYGAVAVVAFFAFFKRGR
jgi:hypothetical protein